MPRTVTRTGRQRAALAAGSDLVADVLCDPAAVTALLGDLIDQDLSDPGPPARWVVPPIGIGLTSFETTLLPRFSREDDTVRIDAASAQGSDAAVRLELELHPEPLGPAACRLQIDWQLDLRVRLPLAALRLAGPALDRTVASTVQRILHRTEAAVLRARSD